MFIKTNRTILIINVSIAAIFVILTLNHYWDTVSGTELKMGAKPLLYVLIALGAISNLFRLSYKLSDKDKLNEYVNDKVAESNAKLLQDIKREEEKEQVDENQTDDIEELVKAAMPSGNFKNIDSFGRKLLVNLADQLNLVQAVFYMFNKESEEFAFCAGYALSKDQKPVSFKTGENITGEVAKNKEATVIREIPADYFEVESGLGNSKPGSIIIVPLVSEDKTIALLELAKFSDINEKNLNVLNKLAILSAAKIESIVKS